MNASTDHSPDGAYTQEETNGDVAARETPIKSNDLCRWQSMQLLVTLNGRVLSKTNLDFEASDWSNQWEWRILLTDVRRCGKYTRELPTKPEADPQLKCLASKLLHIWLIFKLTDDAS